MIKTKPVDVQIFPLAYICPQQAAIKLMVTDTPVNRTFGLYFVLREALCLSERKATAKETLGKTTYMDQNKKGRQKRRPLRVFVEH
jgi:hypothetical protein